MKSTIGAIRDLARLRKNVLEDLVEASGTCGNETEVRALCRWLAWSLGIGAHSWTHTWAEHLRLVLGVELCTFSTVSDTQAHSFPQVEHIPTK